MNLEIFTKNDQFLLTSNSIYKNGELVETGEIEIHHVIFDEEAWIIVNNGEHCPPTFIKTDKVISMFPVNEFFYGIKCSKRKMYQVSFQVFIQNDWINCFREMSAVNEDHLYSIICRKYGKFRISNVTSKNIPMAI